MCIILEDQSQHTCYRCCFIRPRESAHPQDNKDGSLIASVASHEAANKLLLVSELVVVKFSTKVPTSYSKNLGKYLKCELSTQTVCCSGTSVKLALLLFVVSCPFLVSKMVHMRLGL